MSAIMDIDTLSDVSTLTSLSTSPLSSPLSTPARSPTIPPSWRQLTPPGSQDAGEDMPTARKRRKIEPKIRTTQTLDLTSVTAQSEYDRQQALETLVRALRGRRKIVVVAGAGISVSAGIPDFRSSQGLFRTLPGRHKIKGSGKQLFDASVYKDDSSTSHFHEMVRQLHNLSAVAKPTLFHRFLARLSTEGRLLRLYTQNVDGLETSLTPLATTVPLAHRGPWPQTIQLHGGLEKMTCQKCRKISEFDASLFQGPVPPPCPHCVEIDNTRTNVAGKRSHGIGRLRPRIVLYNEHNPDDEAIGAVTTADFRTRPDAVVVVGTSMKIPGVRRIVSQMCRIVRDRREGTTIWINRDGVPAGKDLEDCWDLIVKGDSDDVARLVNLREWDDPVQDTLEEYTDIDAERVKIMQTELKVEPLSPVKKPAHLAIQNLTTSVMTPPRSHNGDTDSRSDSDAMIKPIRINLTHKVKSGVDAVKNPASEGRKLSDVLNSKNSKLKPVKAKTSLNRKTATNKKAQEPDLKQRRINAKVSKAKPSAGMPKKDPLLQRKGSDLNAISAKISAMADDTGVSIQSGTPPRSSSPTWSQKETISPKGAVPRDMVKLLN